MTSLRRSTIEFTTRDERAVRGGRRVSLELHVGGDRVPAILLLPLEPRPAPAALLLHGYSSDKERMVDSAGRALMERGVASIGVDLPLHGERAGHDGGMSSAEFRNPLALARRWRAAMDEARVALRFLAERDEIDPDRLALVGYSMGAYLGVMVAAKDASVRALVLAAGGDLPTNTPYAPLVRTLVDPPRAVRQYAGRPLLMVHGRHDRTILPDQAERLYAAAGEPKAIQWYDGGHWLPDAAVKRACEWVVKNV
ncbi:MAG TPA: alpha/beta fold hydrolase [Gemmatimonadaceae bacterium]|nr:alpha/beta fold hydrolase [Gemmatimonadaceae bacterium]